MKKMRAALLGVLLVFLVGQAIFSNGMNTLSSKFRSSSKQQIPPDWAQRVKEGHMLYSPKDPSDATLMATVGNGYLGHVVGGPIVYISGVFNGLNTKDPSHRAIIPAALNFEIQGATKVGSALDMEFGVFYWRSTIPNVARIEERIYAHRENPYLLVHEVAVSTVNNQPQVLVLNFVPSPSSPDIDFQLVNRNGSMEVWQGSINTPEEPTSEKVAVCFATAYIPDSIQVSGNETFYFITAFRTSLDSDNMIADATAEYEAAMSTTDTLLGSHIYAWQTIWQSRIEIEGDLELAQAVNSSMYYVLSSIRNDWYYSLSPGGLASNGYNGHTFWDAETWMYPTLALLYPELAESCLMYRYLRINGAEMKAQSYNLGYNGTMFPWESAFTGEEVCPSWAATGQLEQHISGDIAFAVEQYWRMTGDVNWLNQYGYPLLEGIATFWQSRVWLNPQTGLYEINGVIPPDEYEVNVNNSVYTNVVAQYSFQFATAAGNYLGKTVPPEWMSIANKIKIPFDTQQQIHPEYDNYSGQTIKQADVVLLGFPLMYQMDEQIRLNDLEYYSQRTDPNGPAMTWGMYAVAWIELGQPQKASEIFLQSYANIKAPFNVWTETPTGGTVNFITGAGGFLQAVWGGYGGIRMLPSALQFNPILPQTATLVRFTGIQYLGNSLTVEYDSTSITFHLSTGDVALTVSNGQSTIPLTTASPVTFPLPNSAPFQLSASSSRS